MKKSLGILVVHGGGNQGPGFADAFIERVESHLAEGGVDPGALAWKTVWWAPVLADAQVELWRRLGRGNGSGSPRNPGVALLADALAYRRDAGGKRDVYRRIHRVVRRSMARLRDQLIQGRPDPEPECPVVVVAHSLGAQILSNYVWDLQSGNAKPRKNPFENFETATSLLTLGSSIPLFTLGLENVVPIRFPAPGLERFFPPGTPAAAIADVSRWWNFYDPRDPLGFPLRPLSYAYERTVHRDEVVHLGRRLAGGGEGHHFRYWTHPEVTEPAARIIARTLRLL